MTPTDTRTNYTKGLRGLADLLDNNPDVPLPYDAHGLVFYVHLVPEALALHTLMVRPVITRDTSAFPVRIKGTLAGMQAEIAIHGNAALSKGATVLPTLVPALAALMNPVKLASVPA
jgi:hypothetical protein